MTRQEPEEMLGEEKRAKHPQGLPSWSCKQPNEAQKLWPEFLGCWDVSSPAPRGLQTFPSSFGGEGRLLPRKSPCPVQTVVPLPVSDSQALLSLNLVSFHSCHSDVTGHAFWYLR